MFIPSGSWLEAFCFEAGTKSVAARTIVLLDSHGQVARSVSAFLMLVFDSCQTLGRHCDARTDVGLSAHCLAGWMEHAWREAIRQDLFRSAVKGTFRDAPRIFSASNVPVAMSLCAHRCSMDVEHISGILSRPWDRIRGTSAC
jgi:hypothetical protein